MTTTDTPRTDNCPHCGAAKTTYFFKCGTKTMRPNERTIICLHIELLKEREARQKAEAEVDRLKEEVKSLNNILEQL